MSVSRGITDLSFDVCIKPSQLIPVVPTMVFGTVAAVQASACSPSGILSSKVGVRSDDYQRLRDRGSDAEQAVVRGRSYACARRPAALIDAPGAT
jgi:hypothetical protein